MVRNTRKMFLFAILLAFVLKTHCISICDSEQCVCWYNNEHNADFVGDNVQCSYTTQDVFKSDLTLPDVIYSLDLSSSNITELQTTQLFNSNTMIELLLNNNEIKEINANTFLLPELKRLDLSNNQLEFIDKEAFTSVKKLQYLNLANNKFTTFTKLNFHHLSNLNEIVLNNNDIGPSLESTNLFDRNGFGITTKIKSLSISGINLNLVPDNFFVDAYDLRNLTISNNNIKDVFEIPFTLEYLDLSDNPITNIYSEDFTDLPGLKVLKLNNLYIREVPEYAFSSLRALKSLELERNRNLTYFDKLAFGKEVLEDSDDFSLESLSLKSSRLNKLDKELEEPFGHLIELDLQGNPWNCDCYMVWIKQLQISEQLRDHFRCFTPQPLYNARIFDLKDKYFICTQSHVAFAIAVFCFCICLTAISIWIFFFLPKNKAKFSFIRNMYSPSTAYSILPLSVSINENET